MQLFSWRRRSQHGERGGKAEEGAFKDDDIRIMLAVLFRSAWIMPKRETRGTVIVRVLFPVFDDA